MDVRARVTGRRSGRPIVGRLPQFVPDAMDRANAAKNPEDDGLTAAEYIPRGIGVVRWKRTIANAP